MPLTAASNLEQVQAVRSVKGAVKLGPDFALPVTDLSPEVHI